MTFLLINPHTVMVRHLRILKNMRLMDNWTSCERWWPKRVNLGTKLVSHYVTYLGLFL